VEGYGMTETSCVITMMDEGDNLTGHVGSPNPSCGEFSWLIGLEIISVYFFNIRVLQFL